MSEKFPESDWKTLRTLHNVALSRFCERTLAEITASARDETKTAHDRYLEIYKLIARRDKELARAFDDPRRSRALIQLAVIRSYGLLTEEEFQRFSPPTRATVELLTRAH